MKKTHLIICALTLCAMSAMAQTPQATDNADVSCNGAVTITAIPAAGFHFVKWVDAASNEYTDASLTVSSIKAAKTFTAHFAANEAIDPSITDPNNPNPNPGDVIQLTPHPDECQVFDHWSDLDPTDPNYAANPRSFTYEGVAPAFTAVFRDETFQVNVNTASGDVSQGSVTVTVL